MSRSTAISEATWSLVLLLFGLIAGCGTAPERLAGGGERLPELRFDQFVRLPVGPKGLEPTEHVLALAGRRVRVRGQVVKEEEPFPGLLMLTAVPVALAERADGPSDYLPPATLFVHLPEPQAAMVVEYAPGVWEVSGQLELGPVEEVNGRISYARLRVRSIDDLRGPSGKPPILLSPDSAQAHHAHHH